MSGKHLHKAGGILIKERKFLLERHGGKAIYIIPGGKLELGETSAQALIREFIEEFQLLIDPQSLKPLESFTSPAVHSPESMVTIDTFLITHWSGEIILGDGIEEVIWVNSRTIKNIQASPIAVQHVLPMLLRMGLID